MTVERTTLRTLPAPAQGDADQDRRPAGEIVALLVERARGGDTQAWSRLYQDHFTGLYRHLRYLTGDAQAAEELVQDTFVQALSCIARYDGRSRFSTWLHGIGLNVARHHWRSRRSKDRAHARLMIVHSLGDPGTQSLPDQTLAMRQRVQALYAALDELPEHLREAFILRELEGLELEEAAAQLGITVNNLAVRTSRARARVRKQLDASKERSR